ncbi:hypothetical protein ACMZ6Y_00395 [Streptococcus pluranimalium]
MDQLGIVVVDSQFSDGIAYIAKGEIGDYQQEIKAEDLSKAIDNALKMTQAEAADLYPDGVWYSLEELNVQ